MNLRLKDTKNSFSSDFFQRVMFEVSIWIRINLWKYISLFQIFLSLGLKKFSGNWEEMSKTAQTEISKALRGENPC